MRLKTPVLVGCVALFVFAGPVRAETTDGDPKYSTPPVSLGQPPRLRTAIGLETGYAFKDDDAGWRIFGNVTPRGKFPHLGIDLMSLELGAGRSSEREFVDFGYYIRVPYFRAGVEYAVPADKFSGVFTLQYALRRGGIFGRGEELRVDYRTRGTALLVGIVFNEPFRKYRKTRPTRKYTNIPQGRIPKPSLDIDTNGLPGDLEESIGKIEHAVEWMDQLLTPRFVHGDVAKRANAYRDHIRMRGHSFVGEDSTYHRELINAFSIVLDGDSARGDQLAQTAESVIFDEILVPYNHLFGAHKHPRLPTGYIERSVAVFDSLVSVDSGIGVAQLVLSKEVFRRTVVAIEEAADASRRRWKTTSAFWLQRAQFTWLPLNYGLRPGQYDSQDEWDNVIERITGQRFTRYNKVEYLINEQFHPHLKRMIHETERYQVLVIHDFQQKTAGGQDDPMGWDIVADGYMRALIDAVRAIDAGERAILPQYQLYIDQNFYVVNNSYDIITYLDNLYDPGSLTVTDSTLREKIIGAHDEMVAAIDASPTFGSLGEDERAKLFKVHVSVTNAWDPTFAMDISMRDHRKFAFRDVFEEDPSKGVGILTGTGVGQHYQPPAWEDRGMVIQGPALLDMKHAVRRLCEGQGFDDDEIPEFLRDRPIPDDYRVKCDKLWDLGWRSPVMLTFNDTGFGRKISTAMRAAIYNLAPKGSVLVAIDSLWLSDFWAGMYICAALRGVHAYGVSPSPVNAPAAASFMMFLAYENMGMLFEANEFFEDELVKRDGNIHVGFYNHEQSVDDVIGRGAAMLDGLEKYPFIREDFPFPEDFFDLVNEELQRLVEAQRGTIEQLADTISANDDNVVKPFLHMKTQFFGTRLGMKVLEEHDWVPLLERYFGVRRQQIAGKESPGLTPGALVKKDTTTGRSTLLTNFLAYLDTLPPEERDKVIFAFTIGSMNQDRRGMISDGEVLACISDYTALVGVIDMMFVLLTSAYPSEPAQFEEVFPQPDLGTTLKKLTRYLQDVF